MIKNIIFDVGDVLIGYRWKEMLLDHGIPDEPEAKEHTGKQDPRRRQQQQRIAQIGPHLLVDLKGFGLPIIEVAL